MKISIKTLVTAFSLVSTVAAFAQESEKIDTLNVHEQRITSVEDGLFQLKKLKFSGYIQAEWQTSQLDSLKNKSNDMKVGNGIAGPEKTADSYNRYGIRRGRLKATYEDFGCKGVIEFDISEGGLKTKDVYLSVLDPWTNFFTVKGGVFDNPFGFEIGYSSSSLESPERSRIIQTLFPDEKAMGAMLTIQAPKTSPWTVLKLDAGLVSGNAIAKDYKSKKDFVGHLSYNNATATMKYGIGVSGYMGSNMLLTGKQYKISNNAFVKDSVGLNKYTDRTYLGIDGQISLASDLGVSSLRGEFIKGTQPGTATSSASNNGYDATGGKTTSYDKNGVATDSYTSTPADLYSRKFQGGYVTFVQDILDTKSSIVVKYDWYDPNTKVDGKSNVLTNANTTKKIPADMAYSTLGLGYIYRMNNNVKLTAYYDIVSNESTKVKGYFKNVTDNVFTLRLQYKF